MKSYGCFALGKIFPAYPEKWANKLGEKVTGELSIGERV